MQRTSPPPSTGFRRAVERRTGPLLVLLTRQPKITVPLVSVALLVGGLALPPVLGVLCLAVLAIFVLWLTYLSWPVLAGGARAVRLATVAMLLALLVSRCF
ncbi:MAG: hypothetical protein JWN35_3001 [Frankiales bacterium]|jgi:hypothetical protein|nr:hypothetical protein [Frankiales bacterium]